MPTLTNVSEVIAFEDDEIIMAIRGKLIALFKQTSGTNANGEWTLQGGTIEDETGKIKVNFWSRDKIPMDWKGKTIELRCAKGSKGGWTGVKKATDKKDNACISVTGSADVINFDAEHQQEQGNAERHTPNGASSEPRTSNASAELERAPETGSRHPVQAPNATENLIKAREGMTQIINCQLKCIEMWQSYGKPYLESIGVELDPIGMNTLSNATVIQMEKERWHLLFPKVPFKLKGAPVTPRRQEAPPPPRQTTSTDVPVGGSGPQNDRLEDDDIPF